MYNRFYFSLFFSIFLFTSCEDTGTTFTGIVDSEESYSNNLSGYGCSEGTLIFVIVDP